MYSSTGGVQQYSSTDTYLAVHLCCCSPLGVLVSKQVRLKPAHLREGTDNKHAELSEPTGWGMDIIPGNSRDRADLMLSCLPVTD
jgi:hypothetical protein